VSGSRSVTVGFVILGVLGALDALGFVLAAGGDGPPVVINAINTVLGLVTLSALASRYRSVRRRSEPARSIIVAIVVSRGLSAILGIGAFFGDVPGAIKVATVGFMALSIVGIALIRPTLSATAGRNVAPRLT